MFASIASILNKIKTNLLLLKKVLRSPVLAFNELSSRLLYFIFKNSLVLSKDSFKGRKVIIIGPANTVEAELESVDLNSFDLIVRMNKAIDTPLLKGNDSIWRIDILFHNLKETGDRHAGKITKDKIIRCNTKQIIFPAGGASKARIVIATKIKMLLRGVNIKVTMIPTELYSQIRHSLSGFSPTTGFVAMNYFMECDLDLLHIVGFTFFQTKYMNGYNDSLSKDADAYAWAKKKNIHDPKIEAKIFKEKLHLKQSKEKNIILGKYVASSLANLNS